MSVVDWRVWLRERLLAHSPFTDLIPEESLFAAGSLVAAPNKKPFLVIRLEPESPGPFEGVSLQRSSLWCHDEPGNYMGIGAVLDAAKVAIVGSGARVAQVVGVAGGVAAQWQGNSGDLADPIYGTILRTSTFDLHGRDGNA